ncbi:MAG: hypothetical protein ACE5H3_12145 [Planctomycetota bacterium]
MILAHWTFPEIGTMGVGFALTFLGGFALGRLTRWWDRARR